jgi:hypothetical protein
LHHVLKVKIYYKFKLFYFWYKVLSEILIRQWLLSFSFVFSNDFDHFYFFLFQRRLSSSTVSAKDNYPHVVEIFFTCFVIGITERISSQNLFHFISLLNRIFFESNFDFFPEPWLLELESVPCVNFFLNHSNHFS